MTNIVLNMTNMVLIKFAKTCQPGFFIVDNCLYNFTDYEKSYNEKDSILEDIVFFKVPSHWNKNKVRPPYYYEQGGSNGWPSDLITKNIYDNIYIIKIKKELNMTNYY